jgi:hypothetical protein
MFDRGPLQSPPPPAAAPLLQSSPTPSTSPVDCPATSRVCPSTHPHGGVAPPPLGRPNPRVVRATQAHRAEALSSRLRQPLSVSCCFNWTRHRHCLSFQQKAHEAPPTITGPSTRYCLMCFCWIDEDELSTWAARLAFLVTRTQNVYFL